VTGKQSKKQAATLRDVDYEALARSLVLRGLAARAILERPELCPWTPGNREDKENDRKAAS
jgi:hypothetical protein